jgi:hypothetical protein
MAISSVSDAIGSSYGLIGLVLCLGFCDGGEEGSRNMGSVEVIWGG